MSTSPNITVQFATLGSGFTTMTQAWRTLGWTVTNFTTSLTNESEHSIMVATIEHNGLTFPTEPRTTTSLEMYSVPPTSSMWVHYVNGHQYDRHFLYSGPCACGSCDMHVWQSPDFLPQTGDVDNIINRNTQAASREEMIDNDVIDEDWDEDWLPSLSRYCVEQTGRAARGVQRARDSATRRMRVWPDEIFASFIAEAEARAAAEREAMAEFLAVHPAVPKDGAYVWVDGAFHRFTSWTDDGRIVTNKSTEGLPPEDVLVAIPIVYGITHENAVLLPGSGFDGADALVKIKRFDRINVTVEHHRTNNNRTISVNYLAVLVPPLNPATETPEAKAERMERELRRLEEIMHRRMVAEGTSRNWCAEFDPILDSSGLKPRKAKTTVRGTLSFEMKLDKPLDKQTITKLQKGSLRPDNHISWDKVTLVDITQDEPIFTPVLS